MDFIIEIIMKNLTEYIGQTLILIQPKWYKNHFELRCGEELLGGVYKRGFFGMRIEIKAFGNEWEFNKPVIWKRIIEIKEKDKQMPFASYSEKFLSRKGAVQLPQGESMTISRGLFKSADTIEDSPGNVLAILKDKFSFKEKTEISIESNNKLLDKYPWVIILAWHLRETRKRNAAV